MRWHGGRGACTSGCYLRFPIPVSLHGNVALPVVDDLRLNRHSRGQLVVIIKLEKLQTIPVENSTKSPLIKVFLVVLYRDIYVISNITLTFYFRHLENF